MSDFIAPAFGILGGVAGSFFGMPWLGYALGSMLGSTLFPADPIQARGPRLSDLKVQASGYGRMQAIVAGKVRLAGNVIWATDIQEFETTSSAGGKGGGQEVEQTQYHYSVSLAIALCEGPIGGVARTWANGKPYQENALPVIAGGGPFPVIFALELASRQKVDRFRVYTGSETQEPDPLIVSREGADSAPAYRGLAYVVIENLQLGEFGNQIPNFEFEVVSAGATGPEAGPLDAAAPLGTCIKADGAITPDGLLLVNWTVQESPSVVTRLAIVDPSSLTILRELPASSFAADSGARPVVAPAINQQGDVLYWGVSANLWHWPALGAAVEIANTTQADARLAVDESGNLYAACRTQSTPSSKWHLLRFKPGNSTPDFLAELSTQPRDLWYGWDGYLYLARTDTAATSFAIEQRKIDGGAIVRTYARAARSLCVAGDGSLWLYTFEASNTGDLYRVAPDWLSETLIRDESGSLTGDEEVALNRDWSNGDVLYALMGSIRRFNEDGAPVHNYDLGTADVQRVVTHPSFPERVYFFDAVGPTGPFIAAERLDALTPAGVTVGSVVSALSQRAGLAVGELDTAALTDTLSGYALGVRGPARNAIAPLAAAYFFDAVESAGVLKFVKRNAAPALTIAEADLGAHFQGEQRPDPLDESRTDESELPLEVAINYFDLGADYQPSTQYERRLTGRSDNVVSFDLPVVMTSDKAKQVATTILHEAWVARAQRSFAVGAKYTALEPTDVVSLALRDGTTQIARITRKDESRGVVRLEGVDHEAAVYTQSGGGAAAPAPVGGITSRGPANLALLDIPLLRDQDDNFGFYAAAGGYLDGWPGGKLFKSSDSGSTWVDIGAAFLNGAGTLGFAATALPSFGGGNVFDELSSVEVQLNSGALANTTRGNALNGINAAVLGEEILCFTTATSIGTKKYRLSGLLRGRLGTEAAMRRHVLDETFALLESNTLVRVAAASSELNVERLYRAVTFGTRVDLATIRSLVLQAVCLKPLAPVLVGGGRNAAGDVLLKWVRRARKGGGWSDLIDVALDEPSESYEVETYAGTVRSLTAITRDADATFTTSVAHGYVVNDRLHITGVAGMTQVNDRVYTVTAVPTTTTFKVGQNAALYSTYGSGGSVRKRGRTLSASSATVTYTAADQTTDYGSAQNPVFAAAHQMSTRVGRGFAGIGQI